ncbi:MAG: hypothetical protein DMG05_15315 [Acidobacteria bacterium]|nr:MAG: hypothetical protein DMG05_15315 [Acidobacteriota bacterium]
MLSWRFAARCEIKGLSNIRSSVLPLKLFLLFLPWLVTAFLATSTVIGKTPGHNGIEIDTRERPRVRAYRLAAPPNLDGLVNEPFWADIEPATNFIQQQPNEGLPATEQTEVRIGFDDDNLYFGIICFDSHPENIVVTQNRRDASLTDTDSIEIQLDTFNDKQNSVIFGTSPTGIEFDGQVSKAGQGRGGVGSPARAGGTGGGGAQRGGSCGLVGSRTDNPKRMGSRNKDSPPLAAISSRLGPGMGAESPT